MRRHAGFGLILTVLALFIQLAAPLTAARAAEANPFSPFPICSGQSQSPDQPQPPAHHDGSACCTLCQLVHAAYLPAADVPNAFSHRLPRTFVYAASQTAAPALPRFWLGARPRAPPLFS